MIEILKQFRRLHRIIGNMNLSRGRAQIRNVSGAYDLRIVNALVGGSVGITGLEARRVQLLRLRSAESLRVDAVQTAGTFSLKECVFRSDAHLEDLRSGFIDVGRMRCGDDLTIEDLEGDLDISRAKIGGALNVSGARCGELDLTGLSVEEEAGFDASVVSTYADFSGTAWGSDLRLEKLDIMITAFEGATFEGKASFKGTVFRGATSFARAHFKSTADFQTTVWSLDPADHERAFRETRFDSFVDFRNTAFNAFSAFDGAMFKAEIRFDRTQVLNDAAIEKALKAATSEDAKLTLEHGFRALKQAAEGVRDRHLEQAFFRYELLARRRQKATPGVERLLSWLYGALSNYGASFVRPALAAGGVWLAFILIYFLLGLASGSPQMAAASLEPGAPHQAWPEAVGLSTRSMFNLFGVWNWRPASTLPPSGWSLEHVLLAEHPLLTVVTRLASTAQSILAGVLLFLLALAARRRFQIN